MKKENCYTTLTEACRVSAERLEENQLLDDGSQDWDIYNLMEIAQELKELDGENNYYCVGHDGSIGITEDNGNNVNWIYRVK